MSVAAAAALVRLLRLKLLALARNPPDQRLPPHALHQLCEVLFNARSALAPRHLGLAAPLPHLGLGR